MQVRHFSFLHGRKSFPLQPFRHSAELGLTGVDEALPDGGGHTVIVEKVEGNGICRVKLGNEASKNEIIAGRGDPGLHGRSFASDDDLELLGASLDLRLQSV